MARDVGRKPEMGQLVACDGESATALGSNRGWFSRQATAVVAAPRGERVALRQTAGGFHHRHMQRILPNLAVQAMKPDRRVVRLREVLHTRQSSVAYTARRGPCAIRRCPSECRGIQPKVDSWHAMKVRLWPTVAGRAAVAKGPNAELASVLKLTSSAERKISLAFEKYLSDALNDIELAILALPALDPWLGVMNSENKQPLFGQFVPVVL